MLRIYEITAQNLYRAFQNIKYDFLRKCIIEDFIKHSLEGKPRKTNTKEFPVNSMTKSCYDMLLTYTTLDAKYVCITNDRK